MGVVRVHYWAAARSAAGVPGEEVGVDAPISVADLTARLARDHAGTRLPAELEICSVLVGELPVSGEDRAEVVVGDGDTVEFLPPFAGG